jgi:hypothetical protein
MAWQQSVQMAVRELKKEEASLQKQLSEIQGRIRDLEGLGRSGRGGAAITRRKSGTRRLSAEGRAAISRAAKKRWAKYRKEQAAN